MWYIVIAHIYTGIILTIVQDINIDSHSGEKYIMASTALFHLGVGSDWIV
jgi:hypothetical protein